MWCEIHLNCTDCPGVEDLELCNRAVSKYEKEKAEDEYLGENPCPSMFACYVEHDPLRHRVAEVDVRIDEEAQEKIVEATAFAVEYARMMVQAAKDAHSLDVAILKSTMRDSAETVAEHAVEAWRKSKG